MIDGVVRIPNGTFRMGSDHHYPEEAPAHQATADAFSMDPHTVTNAEFAGSVDETKHVSVAEGPVDSASCPEAKPELLVPSLVVFHESCRSGGHEQPFQLVAYVPGADWKHPRGPGRSIDDLPDHPVAQVAFEEAEAYAKWAGKELLNEGEWEFAARGGLEGASYV